MACILIQMWKKTFPTKLKRWPKCVKFRPWNLFVGSSGQMASCCSWIYTSLYREARSHRCCNERNNGMNTDLSFLMLLTSWLHTVSINTLPSFKKRFPFINSLTLIKILSRKFCFLIELYYITEGMFM